MMNISSLFQRQGGILNLVLCIESSFVLEYDTIYTVCHIRKLLGLLKGLIRTN